MNLLTKRGTEIRVFYPRIIPHLCRAGDKPTAGVITGHLAARWRDPELRLSGCSAVPLRPEGFLVGDPEASPSWFLFVAWCAIKTGMFVSLSLHPFLFVMMPIVIKKHSFYALVHCIDHFHLIQPYNTSNTNITMCYMYSSTMTLFIVMYCCPSSLHIAVICYT